MTSNVPAHNLQAHGALQHVAGLDELSGAIVEPQHRPLLPAAAAAVVVEHLEANAVDAQGAAHGLMAVRNDLDALAELVGQRGPIDVTLRTAEIVAAPGVVVQTERSPVRRGGLRSRECATAEPVGRPM